jgi:hypothetical protein
MNPNAYPQPLAASTAFASPIPSPSGATVSLGPDATQVPSPMPSSSSAASSLSPTGAAQGRPLSLSPSVTPTSNPSASDLSGTAESDFEAAPPSPVVTATPTPGSEKPLGHGGFVYEFSLANWNVFNGSPLAYTPLEIGWDFGNGWRVLTAYDIFYYIGEENDQGTVTQYNYQMYDWRTTGLYRFNNPYRLRPILGVTLDIVGGQKTLTPNIVDGVDLNAGSGGSPAWGYIGIGGLGGFEYLLSPDWTLQATERYDFAFGGVSSPYVTQLGVLVVF